MGGWTLTEAFEALCPRQMRLYRHGGAKLWEAAWTVLPPWEAGVPHPNPDPWRAAQLLAALCERPDLQLTGHDLAKGVGAERFRLPHYLLLAAVRGDTKDFSIKYRPWLALDIRKETARIGCEIVRHHDPDMPERYPETVELIAVRVEMNDRAGSTASPLEAPEAGARPVAKLEYSPARCRAWLRVRVDGWPEGKPTPSAEECLAAARAHFSGRIARDPFIKVRNAVVPLEWRKSGPRGPRN